MTDPLTFSSSSARFGLPLLFAGQAQKEFYVNHAHLLADTLLHPVVQGVAEAPPQVVNDGQCWIVGSNPAGLWAGQAGTLASWQAGTWAFVAPVPGMRVFNQALGQDMRYDGEWLVAAVPDIPTGGATVDEQARAAIAQLAQALVRAGILPAS